MFDRQQAESAGPTPASTATSESPSNSASRAGSAEAPTFIGFVAGLVHSAATYLGLAPNPASGKTEVDLKAAQQMIEILSMLERKTKGNLTPEEERFLQNSLTDLRLTYVRVATSQR
ncbi:MAG: DUF1844 domain-containing protein [Acidobacteria bacterium]|nr:MAG: DUF1844 domain-containing protein [Acidobacteriota bacterium]